MNYIQKLQDENKALKETLRDLEQDINHFLIHLRSEKFSGVDSAGERKDWIATADVVIRLQEIRGQIIRGLSI